ncbi:LAQU0S10e03290g1_1 [Lachancea quebecensis]|uniref:LAQU0S10e03290g1_1 n=1 Tax=Lachancea quebecensis TaxID=1654605 RepID=A0A0N7MLY2_9SACH|nr:LAQU0S10e03290g1_1 [Lachancea quebecensis]
MNEAESFDSKSILDQVDQYLSDQGVRHGEQAGETPFQDLNFHASLHGRGHEHSQHEKHGSRNSQEHGQDFGQGDHGAHLGHGFQLELEVATHSHVRPEMVFSPVISPVVAPQHPTHTPFLRSQASGINGGSGTKPSFSPLSSPAIDAQFPEYPSAKRGSSSSSSRGKKTPLSTPALTATTYSNSSGSKVAKNSPQLSSRRSALNKRKGAATNWDDMFKLPDSSIPPPTVPLFGSAQQQQQQLQQQQQPPPPPQYTSQLHARSLSESADDTVSGSCSSASSVRARASGTPALSSRDPDSVGHNEFNVTPATLMNYPKIILPSNSRNAGTHAQSPVRDQSTHVFTGNSHVIMATDSPVIQAKNPHLPPSSHASNTSIPTRSTPELQPVRKSSKSSLVDSGPDPEEDEQVKKEVHKAAEQGRRNRLNTALAELHALVPAEMKEAVLIPSKATTVEMACSYIRQLIKRVEELQQ